MIRIGYACIPYDLSHDYDLTPSRGCILKTAQDRGLEYVDSLVRENLEKLFWICVYNEAHGIRFFRITSCIFPHWSNTRWSESGYDLKPYRKQLKKIGKYCRAHGHRLTMHADPKAIHLESPREEVYQSSLRDLELHSRFLQMMGCTREDGSVIIIHGGGAIDGKAATLERLGKRLAEIPEFMHQYLVLENDEDVYFVSDLLPFCEKHKIPLVYDVFHNLAAKNPENITDDILARIFATWGDVTPKIHYSEQKPDGPRGAHSHDIQKIPEYILGWPAKFGITLDIMLEVKDKERSVFRVHHSQFQHKIDDKGTLTWFR